MDRLNYRVRCRRYIPNTAERLQRPRPSAIPKHPRSEPLFSDARCRMLVRACAVIARLSGLNGEHVNNQP